MTRIRDIFSNDRLSERLWQSLEEYHPQDRVYVYRIENGRPVRPALYKGETFPDLMEYLGDKHGGGDFQIMIRRGEKMILSGRIGIEPPLRR